MVKTVIYTKNYMEECMYDKNLAYGNFLDRFRACTKEEMQELIAERPQNDDLDINEVACLAATVETFVKEYALSMPDWVMDKKYYLKEAYYGWIMNPEYQAFLRETSPEEFAKRNVFLGDNVMVRI